MSPKFQQKTEQPVFILKNTKNGTSVEFAAAKALQDDKKGLSAFTVQLFSHVATEDLETYSKADKEKAAVLAATALMQWKHGNSVLTLEEDCLNPKGECLSVLTLVNTNKPFLFDSILGEIYGHNYSEGGREMDDIPVSPTIYLVTHPVFTVKRHNDGSLAVRLPHLKAKQNAVSNSTNLDDDSQNAQNSARISLIQIHLKFDKKEQIKPLLTALENVTAQVQAVFHDRPAIQQALAALKINYQKHLPDTYRTQRAQVLEFLEWLSHGNFIFLGLREYGLSGSDAQIKLVPKGIELGILTDTSIRILRNPQKSSQPREILDFMQGGELMLVTKARSRTTVHRKAFMDYIGLKLFDSQGKIKGELRLVGLFTANAYHTSILNIPYLRPKVEAIIAALGYDKADHSGRALLNILETYPRDDMFRLPAADLITNAERILELGERPRIRVLSNADRFGHFVSLLVFIPRDRYNTESRTTVGALLLRLLGGDFYEYTPRFFDENLTRVHYVIHRKGGAVPSIPIIEIEKEIAVLIGTWGDKITTLANAANTPAAQVALAMVLPETYRNLFSPREALADAIRFAALTIKAPLYAEFEKTSAPKGRLFLKLFHYGQELELSRRVPMLENMGFRVIAERTIEVTAADLKTVIPQANSALFLHEMELESIYPDQAQTEDIKRNLARLFTLIWAKQAVDDGFNGLAQSAAFSLSAICVMRAYGRYLQQAGIPYSQDRLAIALNRYPILARALYKLFCLKFDPTQQTKKADRQKAETDTLIEAGLQNVPALDDDRIIRAFRNLIEASLRSNAFVTTTEHEEDSVVQATLAFKFDSHKIDCLPEPRPYREIFVYGPQVEGVHLRFGPVARGGIRWSDRGQDYRTEILGLVKAQQVKNAVIVPVGAKGGFYPHYLPQTGDRASVSEIARQAYSTYIATMLSITDNIKDDKIIPAPAALIRHDGDDPYFVVAADKGTASFSDTANSLSQAEGFWLDDAFASGGSEGYDHKKIGITAKGAWEAVKRHFRELNHNIQEESFTVAGIGDMSGDVFGNAMLLSKKIKLIAAFDHRDIFIDPKPDYAVSYQERARLFALSRSSWQDYDKSKISAGGGVFSRSQKNITLSPAAAEAIGFTKTQGTPYEIISAILRAPVDLLFFGGIGTYIRSRFESDAQVGDHTNDAVRICGADLRAKVVAEGANLGMTQNGRIEYAFNGGLSNTDAIDNSAGVNCSDMEVNIKIALASAMSKGRLSRTERNAKLKAMTAEVSSLVLRNNYLQTLSLSLGQRRAIEFLPAQIRFMNNLEKRGLLDRTVESLPDNRILAERQEKSSGLTRPELAVLIAYAKNTLEAELANSTLVEDNYCQDVLFSYFPQTMHKDFAVEIRNHRLRREIIATVLANDIVNRGGATFVSRLQDKTGQSPEDILRAYIVVRDGFALNQIYATIDALDNKIPGDVQNLFYDILSKTLFGVTGWFLRNARSDDCLRSRVAAIKNVYHTVAGKLPSLLPDYLKKKLEKAAKSYEEKGAPKALAKQLSLLKLAFVIPDIILIAHSAKGDVSQAAHVYFALADLFGMPQIEDTIGKMVISDYYDELASERARNSLSESLRKITVAILRNFGRKGEPVAAWQQIMGEKADDAIVQLQVLRMKDINVSRLTVAAGILADLAEDCAKPHA